LRFTSNDGLPTAAIQSSAEEQCLVTLNITAIAQRGSNEMIRLDLMLDRRPLQPAFSEHPAELKPWMANLIRGITEKHE